ncbi:MAG: hypothetical protein SGPRY_012577 [Prymnesium sp.]
MTRPGKAVCPPGLRILRRQALRSFENFRFRQAGHKEGRHQEGRPRDPASNCGGFIRKGRADQGSPSHLKWAFASEGLADYVRRFR